MKKFCFYSQVLLYIFTCSITYSQIFTKVTTGSFVNDGGASRSVNFIDYDSDGDLDLFVSNGKRFGQNNFLYNNSGGIFTRITGVPPVTDSLPYDGASWTDFDNDGDPDLCIVTWYDSTTMLYRNNGGGAFMLLENSQIVTDRGFSETCSWGDYDNDGLADLFISNSFGSGTWHNRLYKNLNSGNFARIDSGAIYLDVNRGSRGMNWIDINGDGDLDIYICSENNQNPLCYKNNGGGYFTKVTAAVIVTDGGHSWSSSWGDYDNDGDFDLFVARQEGQLNALYKNEGNFSFTKITADSIVNDPGYHACSGWGDYDNDGDLDMFVTQAYITPNSPLKNKLYKNLLMETSSPGFEKINSDIVANDPGYSYGFAWGDWDADGDLDLFTARTYGENENNTAYLNNGNSNKWIEIRLTGTVSNKSAIGTKVRVKAIINSNPVGQLREVDGQSGYCGQNLDLHFGLGNATVIDSIKIQWPSGITENYSNVAVNQIKTYVEGTIGIHQIGTEVPGKFKLYQNYPNPFNPVTKIRFDLSSRCFVSLAVYDVSGKEAVSLISGELQAGGYVYDFDGTSLASGVYFYRLRTQDYSDVKKMIVIK